MKKLFLLAITVVCASCTKQSATITTPVTEEQKTGVVELHVVILSDKGEAAYGDSSFTFHLSPDYKTNGTDSATIVNQLIHVNQVENHGAPKDLAHYPYTKYDVPSVNGNIITENPISISGLTNITGVNKWVTQICDHGYAPHTHKTTNTKYTRLKLIYPNL
jgi:hypothetical protein